MARRPNWERTRIEARDAKQPRKYKPFKPNRHKRKTLPPGPVEDDIEALALEYCYTRVVPKTPAVVDVFEEAEADIGAEIPAPVEPTSEPAAKYPPAETTPEPVTPVVAKAPAPETMPAPVAPSQDAPLTEQIVWHIQHGVHDVTDYMKLCKKDYDAVIRAVTVLAKQNIIHKVGGRWHMVKPTEQEIAA
jgi:hypothetical protein